MLLAPVSYLVIFRCYCIIKWYWCWILGNLYVSITELLLSDYYSVLWLLLNLGFLEFTFLAVDRKWGPGTYCWKFHLLLKQASRLRIGGNRFLINPMFLINRYLYPCFLLVIWFFIFPVSFLLWTFVIGLAVLYIASGLELHPLAFICSVYVLIRKKKIIEILSFLCNIL